MFDQGAEVMAGKQRKIRRDQRTGVLYARVMCNGVSKKFRLGKDQRKASAKLREIENEIAAGKIEFNEKGRASVTKKSPNGKTDIRVSKLVKLYLEWLVVNRAPKTLELKKGLLSHYDKRYGYLMVSEITQMSLAEYYAWARGNLGRTENGGNHHMAEVKALIMWGIDMELCMMPVHKFPTIRHAPPQTKKFSDKELVVLLKKADPEFRDMILFGILTGLRPQEMRGLTRNHLQEQHGGTFIVMERHKTSMSARISKPRCVPLSQDALVILARLLERNPTSQYIFLNGHGEPYTAPTFRQRLKRACVSAGLAERPPYALRHYFGTKQAGAGLNQTILAQVMGHTTIITTTRYVDEVPEYQQKAMESMASNMAFLLDEYPGKPTAVPPVLRICKADKKSADLDKVAGQGA